MRCFRLDDAVRARSRYALPFRLAMAAALLGFTLTSSLAFASGGDGIVNGGEECDPPASSCPGYENGLGGCLLFLGGDPANAQCSSTGDCFYAFSCCKFNNQFVGGTDIACQDGDDCTLVTYCDQVGGCTQIQSFEALGTPCGPAGTTCDPADQCDGSGSCVPTLAPDTTQCRPAGGECDAAEFCDGAGNCPADVFTPPGVACGDTANECTVQDTCDGNGVCNDNGFEAAGFSCGDPGTECTVQDTCNGSGSCTDNGFETVGTACGDATDGACTDPDTCDGSGVCLPNNEPSTVSCRADAGACDVEEFCDGAGGCPGDAFEPAGTACGNGDDTICTDPDTCDGSGSCQANNAASSVECRPAGGECNAAEFCDGDGNCPNDVFSPSGEPCGDSSDTLCTDPDTCDGSGSCQPNNEPATVSCRAAAGACDVEEFCDGAGACPGDVFESAGTACGDATDTTCNAADTCDGSGVCLDNFTASGTTCGDPNVTECDQADTCDGSGACQENYVMSGVACGDSSSTDCDLPDACNGSGTCDANYADTSVECRAAGGDCDAAEYCDGSGACDPDILSPPGTTCRESTDACDPAEVCDGVSQECPPDGSSADGTICSTGDFCEAPGLCTGGVCFPGSEVIVEKVAKLGRAASSTSDITVNGSNGRALFVKNARMEDDTVVAATTVKLALQASIDDVATSNLVNKADKGEVRGAVLPAFTSPVPCDALTFSCGGSDVKVGYLEELTLPPGSYNRVDVKLDGRLNFEEGEYEICIMKANRNSVLSVLPGNNGDQTVLRFEKGLILGENVTLLPVDGALPPRIEAGKFITSPNCNIQANIHTTDGITKLGRDTFFNGTICAESLKANANVQIGCSSPAP